jgi:hypothetical protein
VLDLYAEAPDPQRPVVWTCLKAMESTFMTQEVLHAPIPPTLYAGIPG